MQCIKYNKAQILELKQNKYVKNVTEKHIVFTKDLKLDVFKTNVIKNGTNRSFYKEVFKSLGFPDYVFNSHIPERSYVRWENKLKKGNVEGIKGRPKKNRLKQQ